MLINKPNLTQMGRKVHYEFGKMRTVLII